MHLAIMYLQVMEISNNNPIEIAARINPGPSHLTNLNSLRFDTPERPMGEGWAFRTSDVADAASVRADASSVGNE